MEPLSTSKNHCELKRSLTDKPDTDLESSDNSEQNQPGWISDVFFLKNLFSHFSENLLFGSSDYETQKTKNEAD